MAASNAAPTIAAPTIAAPTIVAAPPTTTGPMRSRPEKVSYEQELSRPFFPMFRREAEVSLDWPWYRGLGFGLGVDAAAAAGTALVVSPLTAFLDKGITESAAGKGRLWHAVFESAVESASRPGTFVRSPQFFWPFLLYFGTYLVANASETICESLDVDKAGPQLAAATGANMGLAIAKDRAFARLYGAVAPSKLPAVSYLCWLGRDLSSMYFFFTLPPIIARTLERAFPSGGDDHHREGGNGAYVASAARFLSPVAAQLVTTPFHLAGLDVYNRRSVSLPDRLAFLRYEFPVAIGARIARIMPAYSLGGLVNANIRSSGAIKSR